MQIGRQENFAETLSELCFAETFSELCFAETLSELCFADTLLNVSERKSNGVVNTPWTSGEGS